MSPRRATFSALRPRRRAALLLSCALTPLLAAGPASAATGSSALPTGSTPCAATTSTKVFSKFGDTANYSLLPGGNFESGSTGWALGGASVVSGNETAFVGTSRDAKSLSVPAKAVVVSPSICVGIEHPTFRLFVKRGTGTWQTLLIKLRWTEASGRVNETTVAGLNGQDYATWKPTPTFKLAQTLPLWASGQSLKVQIVLDPEDGGGSWQVDDLYVDPLRRV